MPRLYGDSHGRQLSAVTLELLRESRFRGLISQFTVGVSVCLHTLGDLAGSQPLRKSGRQHCQHIKLMLAPLIREAAPAVTTLSH